MVFNTKISTIKFFAFINNLLIASNNNKLYNLWKKINEDIPSTIVNVSSKKLTLTENNVLKYWLKHNIVPKSINKVKLRADIDTKVRNVSTINKVSITYNDKINLRDKVERFINDALNK